MVMLIPQEKLAKTLARGEEALNLIGYIPFISVFSAALRALTGKLQALLGLTLGILSLIAGFKSSRNKLQHLLNFRTCIEQFLHGIANIVRSLIEAIPCLSLVTCLPYDRYLKKRFKYALENSDVIEVEAEEV